jgi:hypothetical protein
MPKKLRTDKQIEKEEKEYKFRRGLAAIQERRRSLDNLERVKEQHKEYVARHGRTWLKDHSRKH